MRHMTDNRLTLADVLGALTEIRTQQDGLAARVARIEARQPADVDAALLRVLQSCFGSTAFSAADVVQSADAALAHALEQRGLSTAFAVGRRFGSMVRAGAGVERVGRDNRGWLFVVRDQSDDGAALSSPSTPTSLKSHRLRRKLAA